MNSTNHNSSSPEKRGVVINLSGKGRGKSSSAFGTLARALGHGKKSVVIQFIKSRKDTGEYLFFKDHPMVSWYLTGQGCPVDQKHKPKQSKLSAQAGWQHACETFLDPEVELLILDEISYAINYGYLDINEVLSGLSNRQANQHIILTGRNMPSQLDELSDTQVEMQNLKHSHQLGLAPQKGIEF